MPENQSQPNLSGAAGPNLDRSLSPQPDRPTENRPSDTETAHAPNGRAVRDPRLPPREGVSFSDRSDNPHPDPHRDYGAPHANQGSDQAAGAGLADRLPDEAVRTPADAQGRPVEQGR